MNMKTLTKFTITLAVPKFQSMDIFLRREINSGAGAGSVQTAGFSSGKRLFSGKQPSSILKSAVIPIFLV